MVKLMGPTVKRNAEQISRWQAEIGKLLIALSGADSCPNRHERGYLVVCPKCMSVSCSECNGQICHCDNDE